ncbi:hypothetical protein [Streptomyces vilmorinianum]|uniref:hypothetical protein n=1 Tax=Streptomyces vilmorinianum TaxID=3051092 RepID=UPI0020C82F0C|nr:hypothetical protein [Streptomyces vilmorinianum]
MTMPPPQSPQPHNPYGGPVPPPQQPGFYGPPQQGFPQQGFPQQGVPQQYPGPGAWGPPPKKGLSAGAIVAIVLGSLVLVGGIGYAAKLGRDGSGAGGSFPARTHELVVRKTLLDGEYTLVSDLSQSKGKEIVDSYDPNVKDAEAAVAEYSGKDGAVLVVSGLHGRMKNPDRTRTAILGGAAKDEGSTLAVPPKDVTPAGHDVTITCQVTRSKDATGATINLPMCAWGDDNTASAVALVTAESAVADPEDIDLAELAETTAKVRAEMREPIS